MATILGISAYYHDSAACLLRDGEIVAAAQEERFTRVKHDARFPEHAVRACLREGGIGVEGLDCVAFYDKPFLKFDRILETHLAIAPRGLLPFVQAIPPWLGEKLWMPDLISKALGYHGAIVFPEHHESHAASAFFPSPFSRAAFLTMDGVGEWATSSWGVGQGNRVELMAELRFPHSLGLLYSAFTYHAGFKVNSGEYKLMGLAPYGEPRYVQAIREHLLDLKEDGSFRMNLAYFDYVGGLRMTSPAFDRLFGGPPREPETALTQREMDLARSIQDVTEDIVLRMARHVRQQTGERDLCLAGGVALNCVANGKLLRAGIFDRLWIQPAAGDAGGSLGAAYVAHHHHLGAPARPKAGRDTLRGALLGPAHDDPAIAAFLERQGARGERLEERALLDAVAGLLAEGKVVGWFQGRMEFGPRALGNRSILGDPRAPQMQKRMNLAIKFREGFRPFAPAVLAERAAEWFEIDVESPYMLLVAEVKRARQRPMSEEQQRLWGIDRLNVSRSDIPAVTHVDYSARLQTVHRDDNPRFHALLSAFEARTGCPVLVNTSFNVRGEPIVESPADAYTCFMRTGMEVLVLGNVLLRKEAQPPFEESGDWRKRHVLD
ncbi:MAG TPA: carbamoyltransferase [Myxococcaceae bacterium]|nr:carbamoyltransferase [Myxococcaceae bacterium]